jgi:hypothetical protein
MLIVGQVFSDKEREEAIFIAEVFAVEKHFRNIARKNRKK